MSEIVITVNEVAEEFSEVRGITVTTEVMPLNIYAMATSGHPGKIAFNDNYTSDPTVIPRLVNQDVELHFHPALGHCSGPQYLAYHESAHLVDFGRASRAEVTLLQSFGDGKWLRGTLSGYSFNSAGSFNAPEALAEAFAAVKCNGGNWAEQALYHMLVG